MNISALQPISRIFRDKQPRPQYIKRAQYKITSVLVQPRKLGRFIDYLAVLAFLALFVGGGCLAAEWVVRL